MSVPTTTKAVIIEGPGKSSVQEVPVPKLRPDYVLVKVAAVAINPTDWKHAESPLLAKSGLRSGCDYAGTVIQVGEKVTKDFKPGDRISGMVHGANSSNNEDGGFAEYIVAKGDLQIKIPDGISFEEAATWGVTVTTVGQGLYQSLGLPLPSKVSSPSGETILIYGGSTATGVAGIQFAKASGFNVIATASPHNFDYLRSMGADAVFDYRSPTCGADIRAHTANKLTRAWDCISTDESAVICAQALSDGEPGVQYSHLLSVKPETVQKVNPNVKKVEGTLAYTAVGERFVKWADTPANPENYEFAKMFWEQEAKPLLASGKVKCAKPVVNEGGKGLEGAIVGMRLLKENKVSAGKLVYTL